MTCGTDPLRPAPTLTIVGRGALPFTTTEQLRDALGGLTTLPSGAVVLLARCPKDYIEAVRHGEYWSVTTRKGGYLTLASFTAAMTTDYSEREVAESRAAGTFLRRLKRAFASPYPERALITRQVQTLFIEYFEGKEFSIPQSGA